MDILTLLQILVGGVCIILGVVFQLYPILGAWKKACPNAKKDLLRKRQRWSGLFNIGMGIVLLLLAAQRNGWSLGHAKWPLFFLAVVLEVVGMVHMFKADKQIKEFQ